MQFFEAPSAKDEQWRQKAAQKAAKFTLLTHQQPWENEILDKEFFKHLEGQPVAKAYKREERVEFMHKEWVEGGEPLNKEEEQQTEWGEE